MILDVLGPCSQNMLIIIVTMITNGDRYRLKLCEPDLLTFEPLNTRVSP